MSGLRDIKLRIKSIDNTRQITKAMNLIATVKLKKTRERAESSTAFKEEALAMLEDISCQQDLDKRYFEARKANNSLFIVITSDRGLCGSYNAAIIKKAIALMENKNVKIMAIGGKGRDFFDRNGYDVIESHSNILEKASIKDAEEIAEKVLELYLKGEIDEVYLLYTEFISSVQYIPSSIKLLPLDTKKDSKTHRNYEFEPDMHKFIDAFVLTYLGGNIFYGFTNSLASEYSSRMMAMSSATENATKMIDELTLSYNRARQASITNEISEIVGGTEALK